MQNGTLNQVKIDTDSSNMDKNGPVDLDTNGPLDLDGNSDNNSDSSNENKQ